MSVFEDFFDFLFYLTIHQNQAPFSSGFLSINSTSFFERSHSFMEQHNSIRLYFDRDKTGQNCTQKAIDLLRNISMKAICIKAIMILMNGRSILVNHIRRALGNH